MNPITPIPDWLLPTILLAPAMLWVFLGVGIPWALAVMPRADWRNRIAVFTVALALGPALTTAAMFFIGTFGHFTRDNVLIASVVVALIGVLLAWRNAPHGASDSPAPHAERGVGGEVNRFSLIDFTLIAVVVVVIALRFWNAAYWPYTTYDEFWVYGYNAKLFILKGAIPTSMGYYPQLVPLAYTYSQLMWGGLNDHAARVPVPIFALASALMAYVLGARLFNRRVGLLTTAIWMLYPQHAAWTQFGDLEVPVTLYFTGTIAFFVLGWRERSWRYVLLSGLLMGAALWTKPTAGALIESAGLLVVVAIVQRFYPHPKPLPPKEGGASKTARRALPPLPSLWGKGPGDGGNYAVCYPLLALIVAAPMGGMWYIRNVLYGHPPLVFPAGYWQNQAQRSGQELGWPLLIMLAVAAILVTRRQRIKAALGGLALFAIGMLPSAFGGRFPTLDEWSQMFIGGIPATVTPTRLNVLEIALLAAGTGLLIWAALPLWRQLSDRVRCVVWLILAFILPYFGTWFWSYSYHYRLSFAIVPALIVLLAALIDHLLDLTVTASIPTQRLRMAALSVVIIALALPGWWASTSGLESAITGSLPDDHAKMAQGNAALMGIVDYLNARRNPSQRPLMINRPMRVEAPGELRLPFFFPLDDIRTERYPTTLDQIKDVDYFIDSSVGQRLYIENGTYYNQILSSLLRDNVMLRTFWIDDKNFRYWIYTIDNRTRFIPPDPNGKLNVQIGDFAWLVGYDLSTLQNHPLQNVYLTFWWQAIKPADLDYSLYIHLWDPRTQQAVGVWGGEPVSGTQPTKEFLIRVPYHTRLWQPGETVKDEWKIRLPDAPPGVYELRVGLYDPVSGQRLPVYQDNIVIGDGVKLVDFTVLPQ
ncbi:MAG: glycosyltransferase family 39 protein [Anaerolineae bacterium]|nr:glycosyltransferase family 39 protein [Anaerolineae bacterium]